MPTYDALLIGDSAWTKRTASFLEAARLSYAVAADFAEAAQSFAGAGVVVVHVRANEDPLAQVARLWETCAQIPVIFLGDDIDDGLRTAAFEAGVAHVTRARPTPQELIAMMRMAAEQSRVGSPELVRGMCRTMCTLSSLVASARDTSFLQAAVLQISGLFQAPIVSIMLFDDDEPEPQLRVAAHVGLNANARYAAPKKDGVADRVARARTPRIILRNPSSSGPGFEGVGGRAEITSSMCVPIPSANGRPRGVINVAKTRAHAVFTPRDLDVCVSIAGLVGDALMMIEAREVQSMMAQRLAAAERLSTIGEIAGGIAHEVANPIACVRANVDVMIEYMKELGPALAAVENEEVAAVLDDLPSVLCEIYEGLSRTEDVVKQMKSLVRLNGTGGRGEKVLVASLVEDTVRLLKPRVRVPVKLDLQRDVVIQGSPVELSQVLVNLVVNAADACEDRRGREPEHRPEVHVAVASEGKDAVIHVVDNGAGMSPATMKRIFMPLFTTKPGERGTGLGLSVVRRVVGEHGGQVRVHSTEGSGTAFVIRIPLKDAPADSRPPVDADAVDADVVVS